MKLDWTDPKRSMFESLLDQLIPPNPARQVPGAGELGIAATLEQQTHKDLTFRDVVAQLLDEGLAGEDTDLGTHLSAKRVAQLEHDKPAPFAELLRATYMAYYSRPDIREVLGLSPRPTQPRGYDVPIEPPELLGALLEPVRTRGCFYRIK